MSGRTVELLTSRAIAELLRVPVHRGNYVLCSRQHIQPIARGRNFRFYDQDAIAMVRQALNGIDARKADGTRKKRRQSPDNEVTLWK